MRHLNSLLLLCAAVSALGATLGGPVAGYVTFAGGSELRAIFGAPGSYRFSAPLALPDGATHAYPAAAREFALLQRTSGDDSQRLDVAMLSGDRIDTVKHLDGAIGSPDWIVFSSEGASA